MQAETDHRYTVRGSWPFPMDMLRQDGSTPATPEDQALVDLYGGDVSPAAGRGPVEIELVIPDAGNARPNTERWASYSWSVPTDFDYHLTQGVVADEARKFALASEVFARLTDQEREAVTWHVLRQRLREDLLS